MDRYDFTMLPDFGETLRNNIHKWFQDETHWYLWMELRQYVHIVVPEEGSSSEITDSPFAGKTIVVTGKVEPYTRSEMNSLIASLGAIAGSAVTKKTDYLVCGEKAGSKLDKAKALGIKILSPAEFFSLAQGQAA